MERDGVPETEIRNIGDKAESVKGSGEKVETERDRARHWKPDIYREREGERDRGRERDTLRHIYRCTSSDTRRKKTK